MSKWAEKFDGLPQEFDKEAIWNGVEKPKAIGFRHISIFWFAAIFSIVVITYLFMYNNLKNGEPFVSPAPEKNNEITSTNPLMQALKTPEIIIHESQNKQEIKPQNISSQNVLYFPKENKSDLIEPGKVSKKGNNDESKNSLQIIPVAVDNNNKYYSEFNANTEANIVNFSEETRALNLLPLLNFSVKKNNGASPELNHETEPIKNKCAKNNIVLSTGIGTHRSIFSSLNGEEELLRNKLEKAQLDYTIGFSYERMLNRNYFISLSLNYSLFKDKIDNAYLDESMNIPLAYEYKLYNHYHVVLGEVGLSRRFYLKNSFIDVSGGAGIKIFQNAESDYFVNSEQLIDESLVGEIYKNDTDIYFTGKTAFGKFFTPRTFMRAGVQARSKLRLSHSSADSNHSLTPAHFFLEVGLRF